MTTNFFKQNAGVAIFIMTPTVTAQRRRTIASFLWSCRVVLGQHPLLAPSVDYPQMVCTSVCACAQHWHSTESTNMWICHASIVHTSGSFCTHTHSHTIWGPWPDGVKSGHCRCWTVVGKRCRKLGVPWRGFGQFACLMIWTWWWMHFLLMDVGSRLE